MSWLDIVGLVIVYLFFGVVFACAMVVWWDDLSEEGIGATIFVWPIMLCFIIGAVTVILAGYGVRWLEERLHGAVERKRRQPW